MSYYTVGDLDLVLGDLFGAKKTMLQKTLAFQIYGPTLEQRKNELAGITAALKNKPLADELADADNTHDSAARAIFYVCKGLGQLATLAQTHRDVMNKVAATFVPKLAELRQSYEDEAAAAKKRQADLQEMKPVLEAFPVAPETTLYNLVSTYIESGMKIDTLLAARAETTAEEEAGRVKQVAALRSRTVGTINQFREALAHEVSVNQELPRDLESRIFSYYDQIDESRQGRSPTKTETATPAS